MRASRSKLRCRWQLVTRVQGRCRKKLPELGAGARRLAALQTDFQLGSEVQLGEVLRVCILDYY
jgi:hypothetical protein